MQFVAFPKASAKLCDIFELSKYFHDFFQEKFQPIALSAINQQLASLTIFHQSPDITVMNIDGNENLGIWSGFTNFVIIEYDKYDETLFNRNSSDSSPDR